MSSPFCLIIVTLLGLTVGAHAWSTPVILESGIGGALGLIILVLDIIAIIEVVRSSGRDTFSKAIWILIILFFPIGGLIIYCCCGRNRGVDQVV